MDDTKVILTGATGFIGSEVLQQCLAHPTVSSVVVLTRRPLPESVSNHPKLKVIIHQDFSTGYPPALLKEVVDANACIWAMGLLGSKAENADAARRVNLDYTVAAATVFNELLRRTASRRDSGSFRFVYLSGNMAVRDQTSSPWFLAQSRRMRGEVENQLMAIDRSNVMGEMHTELDNIRMFVFRPGFVLAKSNAVGSALLDAAMPSAAIKVDDLAAAMVDVAVRGHVRQTLEPAGIKAHAKTLRPLSG